MKEEFLHYVWKQQLFSKTSLKSVDLKSVEIIFPGFYNTNSGPDFLNAKIKIEQILWVGNLEIHVKSSDWYVHQHEKDSNYDAVILHVVWEDDVEVFSKNNQRLPTIEISNLVVNDVLLNYQELYSKQQRWIPCQNTINSVDSFVINNWKERLFFERLEDKSIVIQKLLKESNNDYEAVLFKLLAKNFGLKTNAEAFLNFANSIDFSIVRKTQNDAFKLQALFFGQAGFLQGDFNEEYPINLKLEYDYLKHKYALESIHNKQFQFFRMRPSNFPTIRIAQLASLYYKNQHLFSKLMQVSDVAEIYKLFSVDLDDFWKTHYTFHKASPLRIKKITKQFVDLLLINTVIPLKFNYLNLEFNLKNIIFCLLISLISQFGDLFISFLKRKANLKDTGNILPGHGGALDRVDGIIFAVPFSYFLIKLF